MKIPNKKCIFGLRKMLTKQVGHFKKLLNEIFEF